MPLVICTDSKSLFGLCLTIGSTTEKRLLVDLALIREEYEKRDIKNVEWIFRKINPAYGRRKPDKRCGALASLLPTQNFSPSTESWIEHDRTENLLEEQMLISSNNTVVRIRKRSMLSRSLLHRG